MKSKTCFALSCSIPLHALRLRLSHLPLSGLGASFFLPKRPKKGIAGWLCLEEGEKRKRETRVFFLSRRIDSREEKMSSILSDSWFFRKRENVLSPMSLGFRPYLVAFASLIAGASVVHAVLQPDLVR